MWVPGGETHGGRGEGPGCAWGDTGGCASYLGHGGERGTRLRGRGWQQCRCALGARETLGPWGGCGPRCPRATRRGLVRERVCTPCARTQLRGQRHPRAGWASALAERAPVWSLVGRRHAGSWAARAACGRCHPPGASAVLCSLPLDGRRRVCPSLVLCVCWWRQQLPNSRGQDSRCPPSASATLCSRAEPSHPDTPREEIPSSS